MDLVRLSGGLLVKYFHVPCIACCI
jgi:hypothetical protein